MHTRRGYRIGSIPCELTMGAVALFLILAAAGSSVARNLEGPERKINAYYTVTPVTHPDGTALEKTDIHGPPTPPPGFDKERQEVELPEPGKEAATNVLSSVPAFNWVFGCSAVSGAMIAGYYDRNGYPDIYTGPTNGGVMPLDNSSWPTWSDGYDIYPNCPLIASKNGVDGRSSRGSIDDYWVQYESSASDPYITGAWTQHTWGDAVGDYMKTSQSAYGNSDGSTTFYTFTSSASQLTCSAMEGYGISTQDGTYGRKLFYEARGYTVTDCYNQKTDNIISGGFSFAQYKAEIDAGRPVMLNLAGHTIVGLGYDDSSNLVYIHDTWDYSNHTMTWGGSYSGMALQSVSIVNLAHVVSPGSIELSASAYSVNENGGSVTITATRTGGSSGAVGVSYGTGNGTATAGSDYTAANGVLSWADGDTADKTFTVSIISDYVVEGDETFTITLSSPTGGAVLGSPSSATVTIIDYVDTQPPVNGTLSAVAGAGKVNLSWSGFSDPGSGIGSYKLVYAAGSQPDSCTDGTPIYAGMNTAYLHTGLTKGTTYYYRLCAIDKFGNVSSGATSKIKVTVAPLDITSTSPLPSGTYGVNYSKTLAASGGTKPFTWSVISGTLPTGISLGVSNGALRGKPTGWGDYAFTVQVVDKQGNIDTGEFTLTILVPQLTIATTSLPGGRVGASYKKVLAGKGGVKPYVWSISTGDLPDGLTLDSASGTISGKPTAAGTYNFTIQLADDRPEAVMKDVTLVVK